MTEQPEQQIEQQQPTTHKVPRNYQLSGISFLTTPNTLLQPTDLFPTCCRHILSDAPGAGKTFQATEAANTLMQAHPATTNPSTLIFTPAHLVQQWFDWIVTQYPTDSVISFEGTRQTKTTLVNTKAKWYIVSIQSMRQKYFLDLYTKLVTSMNIDVCIIDESHYVKNPDAITSHHIRTLCRPSLITHAILLSATPIMKEATDLYMQLRICDPLQFTSLHNFMQTYCYYSLTSWGYTDVTLRASAKQALSPYLWGRTYTEIGLSLPPIVSYEPTLTNLSKARRQAYEDIKTYWYHLLPANVQAETTEVKITAGNAMAVMHMLRHIINCPEKQGTLLNCLADDPGPYLIGCIYRDSAHQLASYITGNPLTKHLHPVVISGEITNTHERATIAKSATLSTDIIIATMPSISEGVDLSHANTVYFYEENWTPGSMYQFLSRVRRHRNEEGTVTITEDNKLIVDSNPNERPVIIRYFHADKTIDQRIHAVRNNRSVNIRDLVKVELES